MIRRPLPATLVLTVFLVLLGATGVLAKGDAIVTLDASLPSDPEPGSEITVGWTVGTPLEDGTLAPFNAEGMFVRLIPATGEPVEAIGRQDTLGHYVATITVPAAGIADVAFGLRGDSCTGGTCQRSDMMFTIDDVGAAVDPGAAVYNPVVSAPDPAAATSPASAINTLGFVAFIGLALAAVALVLAVLFLRGRGWTLTPGSSRS